jgi:hypothetical protein
MKRLLPGCAFLFLMAVSAWASDGTTVNAGATQDITAHSVCKRVTNNAGVSVYVPTTSAPEWASFYGAPPSTVSVSACPPTCGGFSLGGYCWYTGALGQSCDTICSTRGGSTSGTINYVGSGGSLANCVAVVQGLGLSALSPSDNNQAFYHQVGCARTSHGFVVRGISGTTNYTSVMASASRFCSCAQ